MDFSKIDLSKNQVSAREIVLEAIKNNPKNRRDFEKIRNRIIKRRKERIYHNMYFIKAYNDLIKEGVIEKNEHFLSLIRKRGVRTISGVAPLTVLTKPYPCPGRCIYCPTDTRMPKSYLPSQPAAQRAFRQRFDPYTQVFVRLKALKMIGHDVSKVELRIIGGTFLAYPDDYRESFVRDCLQAMNEFHEQEKSGKFDRFDRCTVQSEVMSEYGLDKVNTFVVKKLCEKSFEDVVKENESSCVKCIGINIETRPDTITTDECIGLRNLGVTKVEMGVQTLDDDIHQLTKRGHTVCDVVVATRILKNFGFKVSYHMMPNLPGSSIEKDISIFESLFSDDSYKPDYLKIYPCVVLPNTELEGLYKSGQYKSYSENEMENLLLAILQKIPYYCRVDRIARDIPSDELVEGFKSSNIRQILEKRIVDHQLSCSEIRFREIANLKYDLEKISLNVNKYLASGGEEYYLSYTTSNNKLLALLRLRLLNNFPIPVLNSAAVIREVHVYGKQVAVGNFDKGSSQHSGFGKSLIKQAESISKQRGYKFLAVISGIGTRLYYQKLGYELKDNYMIKKL